MHITDVYQHIPQRNLIDIYFKLQGNLYCLRTRKRDKVYELVTVYHEFKHKCEYCGKRGNGSICEDLEDQIVDLFHHLIEHPSIRLEWLFIPYKPYKERLDTQ